MSNELMMDSGISGKTKLMILGVVVVAFVLTIGILMRPGKDAQAAAKPEPVAVQNAQTAIPAPAPAAASVPPDTHMAGNEMAPQAGASAPADAMNVEQAVAVTSPGSPDTQVAAYAPPSSLASTSLASEPETADEWNEASADANTADASGDEVAAQTPVSQPRPAVRPPPPPAIDALHPWWRDPARQQGFDVQYVGQAASEKALVFRFSKNIADAQVAAQHIRVTDDKGALTNGVWTVGNNPYVLVYQGVPTGRYMVSIDPALASASGAKLGSPLRGPVYVN